MAVGLWPVLAALTAVSLVATLYVRPAALDNFRAHASLMVIPAIVFASLVTIPVMVRRGRDRDGFLSSAVSLATMLAGGPVSDAAADER